MGISFISIFILIYHIFFWVCGLAHSLSWDYAPGVPQGEAANTRAPWKEKPIGKFVWRHVQKKKHDEGESLGSKSIDFHAQIELASHHSPRVRDEEDVPIEVVRISPHSFVHSTNALPLSHTTVAGRKQPRLQPPTKGPFHGQNRCSQQSRWW